MAWMDSRRTGSRFDPLVQRLAQETGPSARTYAHEHGAGRRTRGFVVPLLSAMLAVLVPSMAFAQYDDDDDHVRWFYGFPSWTIEIYGGFADHGRLLLQAVTDEIIDDIVDDVVDITFDGIVPQRELTAETSFSFGGAVGFMILPRTTVRLGFNHTSSDLEYNDDTGIDIELFDVDDVADLDSNILSLEIMRFLLPERIRITPYAGLGIALSWWSLDDEDTDLIIAGDDDTETRWGGIGTLGLKYRLSEDWGVRLEAATYAVRNPFTGEDSFVPTSGLTIDEPTHIRQTNYRLVVSYTFGRPERRAAK